MVEGIITTERIIKNIENEYVKNIKIKLSEKDFLVVLCSQKHKFIQYFIFTY